MADLDIIEPYGEEVVMKTYGFWEVIAEEYANKLSDATGYENITYKPAALYDSTSDMFFQNTALIMFFSNGKLIQEFKYVFNYSNFFVSVEAELLWGEIPQASNIGGINKCLIDVLQEKMKKS